MLNHRVKHIPIQCVQQMLMINARFHFRGLEEQKLAWCPDGVLDLRKDQVDVDAENAQVSVDVDLDGLRVRNVSVGL